MDADQVKLDYLGRVHGSLLATGRASNRLALASLLINGAIVAVLAGGLSVDRDVAVSGVHVHPNIAVVLCGAQWISALLFAQSWAVILTEFAKMHMTRRLYYELGLRDAGIADPEGVPFAGPSIVMLAAKWYVSVKRLGRIAAFVLLLVFAAGLILLPLAAQVLLAVAGWRLTGSTIARLIFTIAPLVTLCYVDVVWHHVKRINNLAWTPPAT